MTRSQGRCVYGGGCGCGCVGYMLVEWMDQGRLDLISACYGIYVDYIQ